MNGIARIRAAFDAAANDDRAAVIAYVVAGRPDVDSCVDVIIDVHAAGADIVELGMPFSDPLADGPVIRRATRLALDDGVSVATVLEIVTAVRARGCDVPLVLMGYINPVLSYGIERFADDLAVAGVDGVILPDLPLDEAGEARRLLAARDIAMTFLITPLTQLERRAQLLDASTGFCYAVATTGTTGARGSVDPRARVLLDDLRERSGGVVPIAVGFGVSTPAHVEALAPHADGVIIGSALVERIERSQDASSFVAALSAAARVVG
jgi:tryptophan synthase alpha chain